MPIPLTDQLGRIASGSPVYAERRSLLGPPMPLASDSLPVAARHTSNPSCLAPLQLRPPMSGYGDKIRATMCGVFPDLLRAYQDATADRDLGNLPRHQPTTIMANTLRLLECFMLQVGTVKVLLRARRFGQPALTGLPRPP